MKILTTTGRYRYGNTCKMLILVQSHLIKGYLIAIFAFIFVVVSP